MHGYNDLINSLARPSPHLDDSEAALRTTYRWIEASIDQRRYSPTIFEIAEGLGISYDAARTRLVKMEQRRWISRDGRMRSVVLRGLPDADSAPAQLTFNALASLSDHLAVAMAGHERGPELFRQFQEAYHVEQKRLEMEAQLVEADDASEWPTGLRLGANGG